MKKSIVPTLICCSLLTLVSCLNHGLDDDRSEAESIQEEIEQVMAEENVDRLWAESVDVCSVISSYNGTKDFEFLEFFIRIQDQYYQYDRLVNIQIDGKQMLLCFN
ncbi:MAG: hypothetical protein AAGA77_09960 [Bacteroidota bacterium]